MGGYCSGQQGSEPEYLYPPEMHNGKMYSAHQIWIIVRLQTIFRMWIAQRKAHKIRHDLFAPGLEMPRIGKRYQSMSVQEVREKLGEFKYDDVRFEATLGSREQRPLKEPEENGEPQYEGEWLQGSDDVREGRGVQYWPDGSIHEGYWANN